MDAFYVCGPPKVVHGLNASVCMAPILKPVMPLAFILLVTGASVKLNENVGVTAIHRSSTMSLTTFFGLICLVYTYFGITNMFDIDICDISSCYGLLQLISINYQKQCLSEHIFGWLLMSHDTSPFLDVLLESKHQIFLVFLCFYLNIPIVL